MKEREIGQNEYFLSSKIGENRGGKGKKTGFGFSPKPVFGCCQSSTGRERMGVRPDAATAAFASVSLIGAEITAKRPPSRKVA